MKKPLVSIIVPVIRPEKATRVFERLHSFTGLDREQWELVTEKDTDRIGAPCMVKRMVDQAKGDLICFLGDDTIPQKDFLKNAVAAMAELPAGWGLVGLNDKSGRKLPCHWLAHRKLLEHTTDGDFFHTGYKHCFCDTELWDIAREIGHYVYCETAIVEHDHPLLKKEPLTGDYARVYADEIFKADQALYMQRRRDRITARNKKNGELKLGIALPLCDAHVAKQFFLSFYLIDIPCDCQLLLPDFTTQDIGAVRNNLVRQALRLDLTHLIMMDTDQVYPQNVITKLLSHKVDAVGALVHKRWKPFNAVVYHGAVGRYRQEDDERVYSGELIEVDATGTGCILFDMTIFKSVPFPWFHFDVNAWGEPVGEDICFCQKMKDAGFKIYIDTSVEVGHLNTFVIDKDFYKQYKLANPFKFKDGTKRELPENKQAVA